MYAVKDFLLVEEPIKEPDKSSSNTALLQTLKDNGDTLWDSTLDFNIVGETFFNSLHLKFYSNVRGKMFTSQLSILLVFTMVACFRCCI